MQRTLCKITLQSYLWTRGRRDYVSVAASFGEADRPNDLLLYLTAPELEELSQGIQALHERYADRLTNPELRPPGSRLISYVRLAFPILDDPRGRYGRGEGEGGAR